MAAMVRNPYQYVGKVKPRYTRYSLSHEMMGDMDFGLLYPVAAIETVPGDLFKIRVNGVGRLASALVAPSMARFDVVMEAFFVPKRLLLGNQANFDVPASECTLEEFLVDGKDGNTPLPYPDLKSNESTGLTFNYGGIGDYLGIQPGVKIDPADSPITDVWRAYRWIWNEFYRAEFLQDEIQVAQYIGDGTANDDTYIPFSEYDSLLRRGWRRDRFTSSLPFQQFGTSPALPIEGVLDVYSDGNISFTNSDSGSRLLFGSSDGSNWQMRLSDSGVVQSQISPGVVENLNSVTFNSYGGTPYSVSGLSVDLANAATFDISDLRTAFQIQKWKERNARGGVRLTELYRAHYGVAPKDSRLQRPEFIASGRYPWIVNEVLQTSASQGTGEDFSPQGNQAGQAISLGSIDFGKFRALEFGYIIILASIVPAPMYQQGMPKMFSRKTSLDIFWPEFMHLSEQAVLNKELYISGNTETDNGEFGFQPIYQELRHLQSRVANHMRTGAPGFSYDYWHIARDFAETPVLNADFLEIGSSTEALEALHRIFEVQNVNPFICHFGFDITASRPLDYGEPGLVDHF